MAQLYADRELVARVNDGVLIEGIDYFLDTIGHSKAMINQWLLEENMVNAVSHYHPQNRIIQLRFDNLVGLVNILGTNFDVRSRKLLDGVSGNQQFQQLLDEINAISRRLTFQFDGTTHANRATDLEYNQNLLEILDYYYQLVFLYPVTHRLEALINQCIRQPHSGNIENQETLPFRKSRKVSPGFYTSLAKQSNWIKLQSTQKLANSRIAQITFERTGNHLLPGDVINKLNSLTLNTTENRFIRFFLEDIIALSLRVVNGRFEVNAKRKAHRLQQQINTFLRLPFFKEIKSLSFIPSCSSVLLKKSGYKEIYFHFVQSKFSFRPILSDLREQGQRPGLKNIATLYEIWVFFKVAEQLFSGTVIHEAFGGRVLKNGAYVGSYTWSVNGTHLLYNQTYSRSTRGSYSVTLRPDISLWRMGKLFLFDAKYKFNTAVETEDDLIRVVKPEDVHKMHAYIDAISEARSAIILYPGTESLFYDKELGKLKEIIPLDDLNGVGAISLSPNTGNLTLENLLTFGHEGQ